jgi:hypothetical protein
VGGLVSSGGTRVSLTIERFENGQRTPIKAWHVVCDGKDARGKALAQMAARLVTASRASTISHDWRSLVEYRTALAMLDAAPSDEAGQREALDTVRQHLHRAVEHDQGNLLARFHLGRIERQLGDNETAAEIFASLDALARNAAPGAGPIGAFLSAHPEMRYVARYNRAIALAKIPEWSCHNEALDLLLRVGLELSGDEELAEEERLRLQMLTASAWADTLVFELESWHGKDGA